MPSIRRRYAGFRHDNESGALTTRHLPDYESV